VTAEDADGHQTPAGGGLVPDGPWVACPWCGAHIALGWLAEDDDELGMAAAVCRGCGRRSLHLSGLA
jgi:hypothetical protein